MHRLRLAGLLAALALSASGQESDVVFPIQAALDPPELTFFNHCRTLFAPECFTLTFLLQRFLTILLFQSLFATYFLLTFIRLALTVPDLFSPLSRRDN